MFNKTSKKFIGYITITSLIVLLVISCGGSSSMDESGESDSQVWLETLPETARSSVLYYADIEEGSLYDWDRGGIDSGSGIYLTDDANADVLVSQDYVHSGAYSVKTEIRNAIRSENGNKAVRLMVWTDKAWEEDGEYFPDTAYYSVWLYMPYDYNPNKYEPWDPGDGGWWNIFQFKSNDSEGISQPIWVLNVAYDDDTGEMYLYLYSNYNSPNSFEQVDRIYLPANEWVHIEAKYVQSDINNGEITVWQNGVRILNITGVRTILNENSTWGIGNYTDHISGGYETGSAEVYFDDACVSTIPLNSYVTD